MKVLEESKTVVTYSGYTFSATHFRTWSGWKEWHVVLKAPNRAVTLIDQDLEGNPDSVAGWLMWAADEYSDDFPKPFKELDLRDIDEVLASLDR